jgi:predicted nucleic-acid-binding protein
MIGLDTNIIVRYLTHDDPLETTVAIRLLKSLSPESPAFVSQVVLVELVWVLKSVYAFEKHEIDHVLENLLFSDVLTIEQSEVVWHALRQFRTFSADFSDCLIEQRARAEGCSETFTFDKHAANAGMRLLA